MMARGGNFGILLGNLGEDAQNPPEKRMFVVLVAFPRP
jgi:hypothetical protein